MWHPDFEEVVNVETGRQSPPTISLPDGGGWDIQQETDDQLRALFEDSDIVEKSVNNVNTDDQLRALFNSSDNVENSVNSDKTDDQLRALFDESVNVDNTDDTIVMNIGEPFTISTTSAEDVEVANFLAGATTQYVVVGEDGAKYSISGQDNHSLEDQMRALHGPSPDISIEHDQAPVPVHQGGQDLLSMVVEQTIPLRLDSTSGEMVPDIEAGKNLVATHRGDWVEPGQEEVIDIIRESLEIFPPVPRKDKSSTKKPSNVATVKPFSNTSNLLSKPKGDKSTPSLPLTFKSVLSSLAKSSAKSRPSSSVKCQCARHSVIGYPPSPCLYWTVGTTPGINSTILDFDNTGTRYLYQQGDLKSFQAVLSSFKPEFLSVERALEVSLCLSCVQWAEKDSAISKIREKEQRYKGEGKISSKKRKDRDKEESKKDHKRSKEKTKENKKISEKDYVKDKQNVKSEDKRNKVSPVIPQILKRVDKKSPEKQTVINSSSEDLEDLTSGPSGTGFLCFVCKESLSSLDLFSSHVEEQHCKGTGPGEGKRWLQSKRSGTSSKCSCLVHSQIFRVYSGLGECGLLPQGLTYRMSFSRSEESTRALRHLRSAKLLVDTDHSLLCSFCLHFGGNQVRNVRRSLSNVEQTFSPTFDGREYNVKPVRVRLKMLEMKTGGVTDVVDVLTEVRTVTEVNTDMKGKAEKKQVENYAHDVVVPILDDILAGIQQPRKGPETDIDHTSEISVVMDPVKCVIDDIFNEILSSVIRPVKAEKTVPVKRGRTKSIVLIDTRERESKDDNNDTVKESDTINTRKVLVKGLHIDMVNTTSSPGTGRRGRKRNNDEEPEKKNEESSEGPPPKILNMLKTDMVQESAVLPTRGRSRRSESQIKSAETPTGKKSFPLKKVKVQESVLLSDSEDVHDDTLVLGNQSKKSKDISKIKMVNKLKMDMAEESVLPTEGRGRLRRSVSNTEETHNKKSLPLKMDDVDAPVKGRPRRSGSNPEETPPNKKSLLLKMNYVDVSVLPVKGRGRPRRSGSNPEETPLTEETLNKKSLPLKVDDVGVPVKGRPRRSGSNPEETPPNKKSLLLKMSHVDVSVLPVKGSGRPRRSGSNPEETPFIEQSTPLKEDNTLKSNKKVEEFVSPTEVRGRSTRSGLSTVETPPIKKSAPLKVESTLKIENKVEVSVQPTVRGRSTRNRSITEEALPITKSVPLKVEKTKEPVIPMEDNKRRSESHAQENQNIKSLETPPRKSMLDQLKMNMVEESVLPTEGRGRLRGTETHLVNSPSNKMVKELRMDMVHDSVLPLGVRKRRGESQVQETKSKVVKVHQLPARHRIYASKIFSRIFKKEISKSEGFQIILRREPGLVFLAFNFEYNDWIKTGKSENIYEKSEQSEVNTETLEEMENIMEKSKEQVKNKFIKINLVDVLNSEKVDHSIKDTLKNVVAKNITLTEAAKTHSMKFANMHKLLTNYKASEKLNDKYKPVETDPSSRLEQLKDLNKRAQELLGNGEELDSDEVAQLEEMKKLFSRFC